MSCTLAESLPSLPRPLSLRRKSVMFCSLVNRGSLVDPDGISYELLQLVMQTECRVHIVALFNSILFQTCPTPQDWLCSRLTSLPKVPVPCTPSDLRPIVLSSTAGKLFTKLLLTRIRPRFPEPVANQLCGIPGSQTLDGSCCLQTHCPTQSRVSSSPHRNQT